MLRNILKKVCTLALLVQAVICKREAFIGIDLGTTYSCVCIFFPDTNTYEYLSYDDPKNLTLPSTIYFTGEIDTESGLPKYKVGYEANLLNKANPNPELYIYGFKRIIGIDDIDANSRLSQFKNETKYPFVQDRIDGKGYYYIPVKIGGKVVAKLTPTDLSALILKEVKNRLDALDIKILDTSVSTPVYFTTVQDDETKKAAVAAGFDDPRITKEPVAACVSYVNDHLSPSGKDEMVMVFDFGGGTLDISIAEASKEISEDRKGKFDNSIIVNRFVCNNFLGGENINTMIYNHFLQIAKSKGINTSALTMVEQLRMRLFVESFKIELCDKQKKENMPVELSKFFFFSDNTEVQFSLTTQKFDELCREIYSEIEKLLWDDIEGIFKTDNELARQGDNSRPLQKSIERIILVGGSTRIPHIKSYFEKQFKNAQIFDKVDADKAIGQGACIACVNSSPLSGESSFVVFGVTPLNVGIRVSDGSMQVIVPQNISIPTEMTVQFTTAYDNQTVVLIEVAMGVRTMFDDNEKIGQFRLELKNPKPKGVPKIEVKIEYFEDYHFVVTAIDTETGLSESITFESMLGKPSQSKINQMLENAKKFKAEDEEAASRIEQVRLFTSALDMFEAQFKEAKAKPNLLSELDISYFETIVDVNKTWIEQNKASAKASVILSKLDDLKASATELVNKIKSSEASAPKPEPAESAGKTGRDAL